MVKSTVTALYALTSITSLAIFVMLVVSFSTSYWIEVQAIRNVTGAPDTVTNPPQDQYSGLVTFGIIYGYKQFNYGFGARARETFIVFQEYKDVYNTDMVIVVLVFMIPAIVFALVAAVFGAINANRVPIETIHGRPGLYAWNAIGALSSGIAMSIYIALYLTEIRYEALSVDDRAPPGGFYTHKVDFGYCFWLVVSSFVLFIINLVIVFLTQSHNSPNCWRKEKSSADINHNPGIELQAAITY